MTGAGDAQPPLRILSVEDDQLNRVLLRAILTRADDARVRGASLVEARTLAEARAALGDEDYDVVLLDRRLPDGDGLDLARDLSAKPPATRPAILALTADAVPATERAVRDAGCDLLLTKPYQRVELVAAIARLSARESRADLGDLGKPSS